MLDLVPAKVADVNKTLDTVLELCEYTEGCDITYGCSLLAANGITLTDVLPRILYKLLQNKNLTSIA